MTTQSDSTRRRFFWKAGAALSAPLTVGATGVSARDLGGDRALRARLAERDDVDAIGELNKSFARYVNARDIDGLASLLVDPSDRGIAETISHVSAADFGEHDVLSLADDARTASAELHCIVQTETPIGPDCTLVDMARLQGEGTVTRSARCTLEHDYVKRDGTWKIRRTRVRPA